MAFVCKSRGYYKLLDLGLIPVGIIKFYHTKIPLQFQLENSCSSLPVLTTRLKCCLSWIANTFHPWAGEGDSAHGYTFCQMLWDSLGRRCRKCDLENHKNIAPTSVLLQTDRYAHVLLDFYSGRGNQHEMSEYLSVLPWNSPGWTKRFCWWAFYQLLKQV